MLEDFRQQADQSVFESEEEEAPAAVKPPAPRRPFLGMKPVQRFVLALMLLTLTCMLGSLFLLVTERVVLPFV